MTQDWNRMLKSFRAKTYRNLQEERAAAAGSNASLITSSSANIVGRTEGKSKEVVKCSGGGSSEKKASSRFLEAYTSETPGSWPGKRHQATAAAPQVKQQEKEHHTVHVAPFSARGRSASEPSFLSASRAVKVRPVASPVSSSSRSSYTPPAVKEISSITGLQQQIKAAFGRWRKRGNPSAAANSSEEEARVRDDNTFEHPLNVRVSPHSQTFSHPHRITVFPPFPSPSSSNSTETKASGTSASGTAHHPFSFVRGLRKRRSDNAPVDAPFHAEDRTRSRTDPSWVSPTSGSAPLASKSRSDHSLHRILKDDSTWTVFATLRPPCEKGGSLSKGSTTAWTFGLFSDSPSTHQQRRQAANAALSARAKGKACSSVAPSPELVQRSFTPPAASRPLPAFLARNERRTRSLERCSQLRVRPPVQQAHTPQPAQNKPPPVPSRVRSRSLEKNYTVSTTKANVAATPLVPSRRTHVPPEILATWCTFSEAFGGSRPRQPITVSDVDKDSPGSPVFEELFLPPPHRFASSPAPAHSSTSALVLSSAPACTASPAVPSESLQIVECRNEANKRNSVSCSCSSRSTPRSSPVPPPETVLYGSREAPVLERHCVEGGEFIIAWLSHSNKSASSAGSSGSTSSGSTNMPATLGAGGRGGGGANGGQSFVNKPARGWLHSDQVIVREGINYFVRYIGCLEVNTSMKSLDFDTRSQIAKECINIVCETAGLKTVDKKRKVDRRIQRILGEAPHMEHAGSDVALTISSDCLRISTLEGNTVVACHDMPNISFASGGDPDTLDFVAYVAKDNVHGRACYVLECGGGLAQDVITTIGQAFELRFKEYLKRTPRPGGAEQHAVDSRDIASGGASGNGPAAPWSPDDPEYYNDLPGKVPPDVGPPPVPPLPNYHAPGGPTPVPVSSAASGSSGKKATGPRHAVDLSDNLIDLNSDVSPGEAASPASGASALAPFADHEYVNGIVGSSGEFKSSPVSKDPFDMHPFSAALPSPLIPPNSGASSRSVTMQRSKASTKTRNAIEAQLAQEVWFHGPISRKEAEDLLKHDGDFLVRESQGSPGQYVLTGMQSGHHKHLLLVDPEGVVRTKDRTFDSVSHLINYHRNNALPIISAESALMLKRPVSRAH